MTKKGYSKAKANKKDKYRGWFSIRLQDFKFKMV